MKKSKVKGIIDGTIMIDCDGSPWVYKNGYWKSYWSVENAFIIADRLSYRTPDDIDDFNELVDRVHAYGLSTDELKFLEYGPYRIVTKTSQLIFS